MLDSSVFDPAQLQLRTAVAGTGSLAQQVMADATITGVAAFAAHQLAQATLRRDHAFPGRLLEQASSKMLDVGVVTKAWAVQQPESNAQGKPLGFGNTGRGRGNRR
ncbi:hypothetical protein A9978_02195 [Pseudomonas sp. UMC65]|nr:hypothetical protein [Pseudomonas sp. UMC65]MBB1621374.1 hypothetical protein [Pseudomonas sp. UME65]